MTAFSAHLTIRNLDDATRHRLRLRLRAARHDRSMEEEVRAILRAAVADDGPAASLGSASHALFADPGDANLDLPPRQPERAPLRFD